MTLRVQLIVSRACRWLARDSSVLVNFMNSSWYPTKSFFFPKRETFESKKKEKVEKHSYEVGQGWVFPPSAYGCIIKFTTYLLTYSPRESEGDSGVKPYGRGSMANFLIAEIIASRQRQKKPNPSEHFLVHLISHLYQERWKLRRTFFDLPHKHK